MGRQPRHLTQESSSSQRYEPAPFEPLPLSRPVNDDDGQEFAVTSEHSRHGDISVSSAKDDRRSSGGNIISLEHAFTSAEYQHSRYLQPKAEDQDAWHGEALGSATERAVQAGTAREAAPERHPYLGPLEQAWPDSLRESGPEEAAQAVAAGAIVSFGQLSSP